MSEPIGTHAELRWAIAERVRGSDDLLVVSHRRPDGDAIGSCLAFCRWASAEGVRARALLEDGVPENYRFIRAANDVLTEPPADLSRTTLVVLDTTDMSRVGACANALEVGSGVINIDHHPDNKMFGDINYVDPSASAAALLVQELIEDAGGTIDLETASLLYVGLIADTGCFRYSSVDARTMAAAARLVTAGADPHALARGVFAELPYAQVRLLGLMLSGMELLFDGRLALSVITDAMRRTAGACSETMEGLPGYGRMVAGVRVAALVRETPDGARVSLRSSGATDVREIAALFGGGGHRAAAGAVLDCSVDDASARVRKAVEDYFKNNS
ncbi:bifunctional oligoribonuclease/PAP phosphatase NrnA [bacterium]|nr:bifunctional oligoribonuclease/PAP phosphatase NrnA [bacterium]